MSPEGTSPSRATGIERGQNGRAAAPLTSEVPAKVGAVPPTAWAPTMGWRQAQTENGSNGSHTGTPLLSRPRLPLHRRELLAASLLVVLLPIVGYVISAGRPKVYAAQVEVLLRPPVTVATEEVQRQVASQQVLISSPAVLAPVAAREKTTVASLAGSVHTQVVGQSEVMRVTYEDGDRAVATRRAEAIVSAYLTTDGALGKALKDTMAALDDRTANLTNRVNRLVATIKAKPFGGAQIPRVNQQLQDVRQRLASIDARLSALKSTGDQSWDTHVITPAHGLSSPVSPRPVQAVAAGALIGILLAAAALTALVRLRWRP